MNELRRSDDIPYKSNVVTLIRVRDGEATYGNRVGDKRQALDDVRDGDILIALWMGSYRADAFAVDVPAAREQLR